LTAAITAGQRSSNRGIRRFDARRDLGALADLIELGFAENLDRSGRQMVRGLRTLGRLGWVGGWLSRWLLPPAANPKGYVWEADGEVQGNASLLPVTGSPSRWVMANVVVLPEQRRKGIARELVTQSIAYAQGRGAKEIILQVDQGNEAARALYRSLGFSASPPRTTWSGRIASLTLLPGALLNVRRREQGEWREQWRLAQVLHPEGLIWPFPPSAGYFREQRWSQRLGLRFERHWVFSEADRVAGSASLRWGVDTGTLRMILLVDHAHREKIEGDLISAALRQLDRTNDSITLDYPAGVAESTLRQLGLVERRQLVWMQLKL
jgi:ribosomal protein S18 acetylase RimI-like enzyme